MDGWNLLVGAARADVFLVCIDGWGSFCADMNVCSFFRSFFLVSTTRLSEYILLIVLISAARADI